MSSMLPTFVLSLFFLLFNVSNALYLANETFNKILMNSVFQNNHLKSSNFPNNYPDNVVYRYDIDPLEGWAIALTVEAFSTELNYDNVTIFQTYLWEGKANYTRHRRLSGSDLKERIFFTQVSGGFHVIFETDSSTTSTGFRMSFQRFNPSNDQTKHFLQPCPNILQTVKATWKLLPQISTVMAPQSSCVFKIYSEFSVAFEIKEVSPNVNVELDEYKDGKKSPLSLNNINAPREVTSHTSPVTVVISVLSDQSPSVEPYRISIRQANNPCICPPRSIELGVQPHSYLSPGYPLDYCPRLNCLTSFTIDRLPSFMGAYVIQIEFHDFKVEAVHDIFELQEEGKTLKVFTPFDEQPPYMIKYFTFSSSNASISFVTDETIGDKGFNLTVRRVYRSRAERCQNQHREFKNQSGNVAFSFYDRDEYLDCFWSIIRPKTVKPVQLELTVEYNFSSRNEFVEVYNDRKAGPSADTIRLPPIVMPSGDVGKRAFLMKDGEGPIHVWYHMENNARLDDIEITSSEEDDGPPSRTLSFSYKWITDCDCGNSILNAEDDWQRVFEFDFSEQACQLLNCTYIIIAPIGQTIELANLSLIDPTTLLDNFTFSNVLNHTQIYISSNIDGVLRSTTYMFVEFRGNLSAIGNAFGLVFRSVGHHSNMVSQNTHNTVHLLGSFLIAFLLILIIGLVACVFFLYGRQKEIESQRECGFSIPRFSSLLSHSSMETDVVD